MKKFLCLILTLFSVISFCACSHNKKGEVKIDLPENINLTEDNSQPKLKVYDINKKEVVQMELEEYLLGVVAGEMFNTWSKEALKAQAVLARTYTLYYLQNFKSKYSGADISNDVTEAQAYDASRINNAVREAVQETEGIIITSNGEPIEAWFHSNSGGATTMAKDGLNYLGEENYTMVKKSVENNSDSENYEWGITFTKTEVLSALREMGLGVSSISSFSIGEKDESGRVKKFRIGTTEIDANTFRIKIGSTKMKSTLITDIVVSKNSIYLEGRGYGHGVGMSQWGAKIMADKGQSYEDIINFYFDNIQIGKYSF